MYQVECRCRALAVCAPLRIQAQRALLALEQADAQPVFQLLQLSANRTVGNAQFGGSLLQVAEACYGLEGAQCIERW